MNKKHQTTFAFKALSMSAILAGSMTPALALDACLPTCITNDAKMLSLAGTGLATLSGDSISLSLAAPAGSAGFDLGIFDGDVSGLWDRGPTGAAFSFVLYADPTDDGTGTVEVGRWTHTDMVNNGWKVLPITNHPAAQSPSGNYFYRLRVINDNPAVVANNGFKVKVSGGASLGLKPQAFSFMGSSSGRGLLETVYPQYPSLTPTTYDGNWKFLLKVPAGAKSLAVWDGDLDFGDADGNNKDTDDADTPNNILPAWAAGTAAVFEGIAISTPVAPATTGIAGMGSPADDTSEVLFRRAPSVNYTLCARDGVTCYANTNPSGNTEWEQFKIDTVGPFDPAKMDHLAPAIPAGIWSVNLKGVDLGNLNAYRAQYEIIAPPQCPSADPCDLPDPPAPLLPFLVGDTIWLDTNANGTQEAGEAGMSGVVVNLIDVSGTVIGTATTDAQGKYSFQVENGVYTVKVDASNFATGGVLANYTPTVDYSGDNAGDNERSQSVAGANVLTYDFGYVMKCDLSSAQTLTQGGWSNKAHADLLDGLLKQGKIPVSIGNSQNSVTLTTPAYVQAFLPSGGTSRQLVGKATNPGNIKNTLAGQTLTATLNYLQWNSLAGAKLKSGPYAGKTVAEVVNLANQALGSGSSKTVLSNLTNALDTINNNLDDGKVDRGNLVCPSR